MIYLIFLAITVWCGVETQLVTGGDVAWTLTTRDPGVMTYPWSGNLTFTSDSGVPLESCECRIHWHDEVPQPVMDLSGGQESLPYSGEKYKARYAGRGLDEGQCGIHLSDVHLIESILTCRARAASGGWQEQSVVLLDKVVARVPVTSQARVVAAPGSTTTVSFTAGRPLTECKIYIPGDSLTLIYDQGHASPSMGRYRYHGTGLKNGQCGVTISGVTGRDSGVVWGYVRVPGVFPQVAASLLIVTAAPSAPELHLSTGTRYKAGDVMNASCTVRGGVPQATISWFLGGELIRSDEEDDHPDLSWKWSWESKTITQALSYRLTAEDPGRELICRAGHPLLTEIVEARRTISVTG